MSRLTYRRAAETDLPVLAEFNHLLIRDEGHRNQMTAAELEDRMRRWLAGEYEAAVFEIDNDIVAYALYRSGEEEIYLRQFFVVRDRRRQGLGRQAMEILFSRVWPKDRRILVEVLYHNRNAWKFWKASGFSEYSLALEIMPGRGQ